MRTNVRVVVTGLFVLVLLAGCSSYTDIRESINKIQSKQGEKRLEEMNGTYTVGASDVISITVRDNRDLNTEVVVRPDGNVTVPLLKDIYVEGLTPVEIAQKLDEEYANYIKDVETWVTVIGFNSKRIYVFGEVVRQGPQPFTGDVSLLDAISNAGSVTRQSSPTKIRVVRGDLSEPKIWKINLKNITMEGQAQYNLVLREDDIVFVPTNPFAKVGYAIDNLLYPFRSILAAAYTFFAIDTLGD